MVNARRLVVCRTVALLCSSSGSAARGSALAQSTATISADLEAAQAALALASAATQRAQHVARTAREAEERALDGDSEGSGSMMSDSLDTSRTLSSSDTTGYEDAGSVKSSTDGSCEGTSCELLDSVTQGALHLLCFAPMLHACTLLQTMSPTA